MAGRDEYIHENPNTFDIDRPNKRHLTFSTGPHTCIGNHLARMELRILTEEWLRRIPRFSLAPKADYRFRLGNINALNSLPLVWSGTL
jgi:cytochrome P450